MTQDETKRELAAMGMEVAYGPMDFRPGAISRIRLTEWNKAMQAGIHEFIRSGQATPDAAGHLILNPIITEFGGPIGGGMTDASR